MNYTIRKYMGDDIYSWALFRDGQPIMTGLSRSEAETERNRRQMPKNAIEVDGFNRVHWHLSSGRRIGLKEYVITQAPGLASGALSAIQFGYAIERPFVGKGQPKWLVVDNNYCRWDSEQRRTEQNKHVIGKARTLREAATMAVEAYKKKHAGAKVAGTDKRRTI
jgi:hypothetical protein